MECLKRGLLVAALAATYALAQCSTPEFFGSSEILPIGQRAFSVVNGGNGGCSGGGLSGNVWLIRPGDSSFQAIQMGYFDATNGGNPNNSIVAPSVSNPGYGYRIIIAPDPSSTPIATSPTFALVTNDWYSQSFDAVAIVYPSPQSDSTTWSSGGEQLLAYQAFENLDLSSFTVLLYNADDVSQSPTTVTTGVPIPSIDQTTDLYYFTIQNTLPTGSHYQLVLVPSADQTDKVLSMSGLLQIQDGNSGPATFPYTYTQVRTIGASAAATSASSSGSSAGSSTSVSASSSEASSSTRSATSPSTSTSSPSALPVENPYPSQTPSNHPSGSTATSSTSGSASTSSSGSSTASASSASSITSTTSTSSVPASTTLTSGGTTLVVPASAEPSGMTPSSRAGQSTQAGGGGSTLPQASLSSSSSTSGALRVLVNSWRASLVVSMLFAAVLVLV